MPVLATITAITLLRGDGESPAPFFEADKLRGMLTDALEGSADEDLKRSIEIADQLDAVLGQYRASVEKSIDAYVEELSDPETDAADLIKRLEPLDQERASLMETIISTRQRLLTLLADEQWDAVFNE